MRRVPEMYPSVETEERIFRWMILATLSFFLLAATSITPNNRHPGNHRHTEHVLHRHPGFNASLAMRQYEMVKEQVVGQVFLKLKDEFQQFWSEHEAKSFLSPRSDSKRKAACGGWASDVPSLVLRYMGKRCAPFELLDD